jgi:hydrogenase maturation protease
MKRIICIGNRYIPGDDTGARVYDRLVDMPLDDVEIIDGGLAGLDLVRLIEGTERIVFVDSITGSRQKVSIFSADTLRESIAFNPRYDHASGLEYLLQVLPVACEGALPEVFVVGVEGAADEDTIALAAQTSLRVAATADRVSASLKVLIEQQ